jgi:hypothetical protein
MPTPGNCAGVGVEIPELPTPLGTGSLVPVPSEPLGLGVRRDCERVGFAEKSSQAWGGVGDQVPCLDSDATCPRDQPTCDSGEFTKHKGECASGSSRIDGAGGGSDTLWKCPFPSFNHSTNPARNVGLRIKIKYN